MNTKEMLIKAKALISDENNWTKGSLARDKENFTVHAGSPEACRFCSLGALRKVALEQRDGSIFTDDRAEVALSRAAIELTNGRTRSIVIFNDTQGHEAVMAMFDVAIESAP